MAHRGCINVGSLPLQILLKDNPSWAGTPVAVTKEEKPRSPIIAVNREARHKGLTIGMRYANALSLVAGLRARAVPRDRITRARDSLVALLSSFTPDVEPCPFDDDAFWVSVEGLGSLFSSESQWIGKVQKALLSEGFEATIIVGFTRFGTYTIARSRLRSMVFASRDEEKVLMSRSSIELLPLSFRAKSALRKLEIRTLRQFIALPEMEMVKRFGKEAGCLRQAILSDDPLPIQPRAATEETLNSRHLDFPLVSLDLLLSHIEELVTVEVGRSERNHEVISELTLILRTEDGEITTDAIRPAIPTLRVPVLRRLIRLRLSARTFSSGIDHIEVRSARTRPSQAQQELFKTEWRNLEEGAQAIARIRARFGNISVVYALLCNSHLPEKSFLWMPLKQPLLPALREEKAGTVAKLVRRFLPQPVQARCLSGVVCSIAGPLVVSGLWWEGKGGFFSRDYYYSSTSSGVLWYFVDRLTNSVWLQGVVD
jgi:nucleotidyltransferase/DNA polymerase involved in DNA repair